MSLGLYKMIFANGQSERSKDEGHSYHQMPVQAAIHQECNKHDFDRADGARK